MSSVFTTEQAQHILQQTQAAMLQDPQLTAALGGPNAIKCWSCRIGLNTAIGGVIAAAIAAIIATGGTAAAVIGPIVALTGLSEGVVAGILATVVGAGGSGGAAAVEAAIEALCKAMGACS